MSRARQEIRHSRSWRGKVRLEPGYCYKDRFIALASTRSEQDQSPRHSVEDLGGRGLLGQLDKSGPIRSTPRDPRGEAVPAEDRVREPEARYLTEGTPDMSTSQRSDRTEKSDNQLRSYQGRVEKTTSLATSNSRRVP